jgi:hypothetical protein
VSLSRRAFFTGLGAVLAAPVIVRASSIMPVRPLYTMTDFKALMERKMKELEEQMVRDMTALINRDVSTVPFLRPYDSEPFVRRSLARGAHTLRVPTMEPDFTISSRQYQWKNSVAVRVA